jgi:hypothetical protein
MSFREGPFINLVWEKPNLNGLEITSYNVVIQAKNGTFYRELANCDGSDQSVVESASCQVPISILIAEPFLLALDDPV